MGLTEEFVQLTLLARFGKQRRKKSSSTSKSGHERKWYHSLGAFRFRSLPFQCLEALPKAVKTFTSLKSKSAPSRILVQIPLMKSSDLHFSLEKVLTLHRSS